MVEGQKGYGILTSCTEEAVFLELTDRNAKLGIINLEIKNVIEELRKQLLGLAQPIGL